MPVFRRVRDLFGRADGPSSSTVTDPNGLPALIDAEVAAISARAGRASEGPAREVRKSVASLRARLERLATADWNQAHHPKLEQISRTTLPAFVRAMDSCLARPLPDDAREFYAAATALLKCLVSALRGQGRYLRAVLPDEMSAIKTDIDLVGRAVNAMTAALGEERRELEGLEGLRGHLERMAHLESEEEDASRRVHIAADEIAALAAERSRTENELSALNASPAARELDERGSEAARLRARAGTLEAAHRAQADGLIQVLRRAERLVAKGGDRQTATRLHHLQSTLDRPLPDQGADLASSLAGGLAVVRDLVGAGKIAPKEGDPVFDDPAAVVAAMGSRADDHARAVGEAASIERTLAASPVAQDRERLAGRLRQLDHRVAVLEDEQTSLARVADQKAKERASLRAGLGEEVETVFAGRVRLGDGDA